MRLTFAVLLVATLVYAQYPRPRRPERFDTAEQISNYLKELQEYYSVHGRGRYGKRQMHISDASVIFKEIPFFDEDLFKKLGYKK
ncbi:unnamed protein product [Pieris macdunnoughi]|uniref:Neuropeptide Y n=1 Tax=Pieris macdunnoughi TaxID=345717 RepID=A0A821KQN9_9NEOP|nr:unnamed protein product [Pieris macdunnoughi]